MFGLFKRTKTSLILILFLGFFVRLINLNQSLWLDEAIEILAVKNNSFLNLITKYSLGDFHPPLYHLILKFWTNLFGYSEVVSRFPSIIFGLGTVYFVFLIGRKLFSEKVGVMAALFLAINPLAVYYSQEARMYSLAAIAVTGAMYFFISKRWFWYFFFLAVAMYMDYIPWLMLPVFLLLSLKNKKLLIAHCLLFILFLPWLPFFWQQLHIGTMAATNSPLWGQVVGGLEGKTVPLLLVKFIIGRISLANKVLYVLILSPIIVVYGYLLTRAKNLVLWWWFLIPILIGVLISFKIPVFSYFRFLFILPAFVLLLARGAQDKRWLGAFVFFISLISLAIFNLDSSFQRENWRSAVSYINSRPGLVLMPSRAQVSPLQYYSPNQAVEDKNSFDLQGNKIVYLIRYVQEISDPSDSLRTRLESAGYQKKQEKGFNGVVIWRYQKI